MQQQWSVFARVLVSQHMHRWARCEGCRMPCERFARGFQLHFAQGAWHIVSPLPNIDTTDIFCGAGSCIDSQFVLAPTVASFAAYLVKAWDVRNSCKHNGAVLPLSSAPGGAGPMALMLCLDLVI
jgi:hypothetical protein